jgi:hypothetical protein
MARAEALKLVEMLGLALDVARTHRGEVEELGLACVESKLGGLRAPRRGFKCLIAR